MGKIVPYLIVLGTAIAGVNVMQVLLLGIISTGIIGICTDTGILAAGNGLPPLEQVTFGTAFSTGLEQWVQV